MREYVMKKSFVAVVTVMSLFLLSGCFAQPKPPSPQQVKIPQPIMDNSGKYLCPYTQDGVMAEWTDKAIGVGASGAVGGAVGAYAGAKLLEQVPFVGGWLGQKAGNALGREIALKSAGGEEFMKETSDISFNTVNELSVYMYAKFSGHEHYQDALKSTMEIYPDMKQTYMRAIYAARVQ